MVLTSSPVGADNVWKNLHVTRICLAAKHAWKRAVWPASYYSNKAVKAHLQQHVFVCGDNSE